MRNISIISAQRRNVVGVNILRLGSKIGIGGLIGRDVEGVRLAQINRQEAFWQFDPVESVSELCIRGLVKELTGGILLVGFQSQPSSLHERSSSFWGHKRCNVCYPIARPVDQMYDSQGKC